MEKVNQKMMNIKTIIDKLSDAEMDLFTKILNDSGTSLKDIDMFKKMHAKRKEEFLASESPGGHGELIDMIYKEEFYKLIFLTNNKELINKLNGLKILLHGKSGTGKTSFAKSFINKMKGNYFYEEIHFEKLISYKMGQTQNNLLKLLDSIVHKSKTEKMIVFVDEIDSIVVNREATNDIGEHSRVVASFLKFIDSIPQNVILIATTNISSNLDKALLRRFNVKIEGKKASKSIMLETLCKIYKEDYSERQFNALLKEKEINFSVSEINDFINEYEIDKAMDSTIDLFAYFLVKFNDRIKKDFTKLSVRVKKSVNKIGQHE